MNIGSYNASLEYRILDMVSGWFTRRQEIWIHYARPILWCWRVSVRVRRFSRFCYVVPPLPVLAREDDDMPMIENARHCRLASQESKKISENGTCTYVCECVYCLCSSLLLFCEPYAHIHTHSHTYTHPIEHSLRLRTLAGDLPSIHTHTHTHPRRE